MKPTSSPAPPTTADEAIADALRAFVCALGPAAADVRIEYHAGTATLTGAVATATQRQAIEDLVAAHDGVTRIVSELRVAARGVPAPGL